MTTISDLALNLLRATKSETGLTARKIKGRLAIHFDKHYNTIENWVKNGDAMLTTPDAVRIISEGFGLTENQILVRAETQAA